MRDQNQDLLYRRCNAYEVKIRAELLAEARRPVSSISESHLDRLRGQMEQAQRWSWPQEMRFNL